MTQLLLCQHPLAPEFDHPDHYLANITVTKFQLDREEENVTVTRMRDAVNILLLLQSELQRRFCLTFSLELRLEMAGTEDVWRLCHQLRLSTDIISTRLGTVLRYHQCLGVEESPAAAGSCALTGERTDTMLGPSLSMAGLHLQNCLLKVRQTKERSALSDAHWTKGSCRNRTKNLHLFLDILSSFCL